MSLEQAKQDLATLRTVRDRESEERKESEQRLRTLIESYEKGESAEAATLKWELDKRLDELHRLRVEEDQLQDSPRYKQLLANITRLRADLSNLEQYSRHMERQTVDDRERISKAWAEFGAKTEAFYEEDSKRLKDFVTDKMLPLIEGGEPPRKPPTYGEAMRRWRTRKMLRGRTSAEIMKDLYDED